MESFDRTARYWLVVASREHVDRAVAGGFVQACHGKLRPLQRMRAGDGVICYSPRERMDRVSPRVQAFVALGRLGDDRIYPFVMPDGTELPPTGKRAELKGMELVQFRDGKVAVHSEYWDNRAVAGQLSVLPEAAA